ncbi:Beta-hexosaminidase [Enhygromyxa salina]|uniref:beta-N-acetylhexosaminidase n=2 Tax=Enhygromyxa salina TaxID=215803 RepID=A0A2S9XSY5_9BACT|nr:Beta-hexosaminidase [Enhygromyxa salina]
MTQAARITPALLGLALIACRPAPPSAPAPAPASAAISVSNAVLPLPAQLEPGEGLVRLAEPVGIHVTGDPAEALSPALTAWIEERREEGDMIFAPAGSDEAAISIEIDPALTNPESYELQSADGQVHVRAASPAGAFYALQTLRQLVHDAGDEVVVPELEISDAPRFSYRGLHLDAARHFYGVEQVERYIDLMSRFKFNTFHWHLTDDQGWRVPIDSYPRLIEVGSCRAQTVVGDQLDPYVGDGTPYCGHYTKDEIREVVRYAAERFVTVIPEIELPGHATAALAAYPELACSEGPFEVGTTWGVFTDIYCPKESTFEFLEAVLAEVVELFPSRYIHIGGDEAPKLRWQESEVAQELIQREGLADEDELQSYFIHRIESFLRSHDRNIIGWDEILEGGLAPEATVMSWRGTAGGIEAARMGHDVIMTPVSHVYFDYYQGPPSQEPLAIGGYIPLAQVYAFEPVPSELSREEAGHILGAQANLWTEYISTWDHAEYMAYPRALALSEVVWSPAEARDWSDFLTRLPAALVHLDHLDVNYRVPDVYGLDGDQLTFDDELEIELAVPLRDAEIRYTLDGTDPGEGQGQAQAKSERYEEPLHLSFTELGQSITVSARGVLPDGRMTKLARATYTRTSLRPAAELPATSPGLERAVYEGQWSSVQEMLATEPGAKDVVPAPELGGDEGEDSFGFEFTGWIRVPSDGIYTFVLISDDGSVLWIGDQMVVDNDGVHGPAREEGAVALAAGAHPFRLAFFQAQDAKRLQVGVYGPGFPEAGLVPSAWFVRPQE